MIDTKCFAPESVNAKTTPFLQIGFLALVNVQAQIEAGAIKAMLRSQYEAITTAEAVFSDTVGVRVPRELLQRMADETSAATPPTKRSWRIR